jgi:diaminopimelate epimerase
MKGSGSRAIREKIRVLGERIEATCLSMGNPHCVVFVDKVDAFPVEKMGPALENHNLFPRRTNVEFVQVISQSELRMRVWERGAGETLACGTGASAAVVAANLTGRTGRRVGVHLPGGELKIEWNASDDHVYMTGPVETVFRGEWSLGGL